MSAEGFIGVDDGDARIVPTQLSCFGLLVPEGFREKEVIVFQLSIVVIGRNVEIGSTSTEVIVHSVSFGSC